MMHKRSRSERRVSLSNELHSLLSAIDGVRNPATASLELEVPPRRALDQIEAILILVVERVRLLDRAARGQEDPRIVWCRANDSVSALEGADVSFPVW
jgi:hypothetical protein